MTSDSADEAAIREARQTDREALLGMYRTFDPLGAAQGLPPVSESGRKAWIDRLLEEGLNLVAGAPDRPVVGHVVLMASGPEEAEIAFFVHQDWRQRRLGTRLVRSALDRAASMRIRRVWATVLADNVPALRLLHGQGFSICVHTLPSLELELLLPRHDTVLV